MNVMGTVAVDETASVRVDVMVGVDESDCPLCDESGETGGDGA